MFNEAVVSKINLEFKDLFLIKFFRYLEIC